MNIIIPRKNHSEMILYLWKIIDLPFISLSDLLFTISYELFFLPPDRAISFINSCIKEQMLIKDKKQYLKLSIALENRIKNWQKKRTKEILDRINDYKRINHLRNDIKMGIATDFNNLVRSFIDIATVNKAAQISNSSYKFNEIDAQKGIIKSEVAGSTEEPYVIEINTKEKLIRHNCHDFKTRRAKNKKFCKHLIKLFLLLKNENEDLAIFFLKKLAENIDDWDFIA